NNGAQTQPVPPAALPRLPRQTALDNHDGRPMNQDENASRPQPHFTYRLWTAGIVGRDPFGEPVRPALDPVRAVQQLAQLGAYGVNLHDDDLVPSGTRASERDRIVKQFKAALQASAMKVPMATTNLFSDPVFRDGAFTSNDARVRAYAIRKT